MTIECNKYINDLMGIVAGFSWHRDSWWLRKGATVFPNHGAKPPVFHRCIAAWWCQQYCLFPCQIWYSDGWWIYNQRYWYGYVNQTVMMMMMMMMMMIMINYMAICSWTNDGWSFLRVFSWLSWWKICFHQHWMMQTPRKISKRWWLVIGWTGSLGNDAWEDAAVFHGGYTTQVMASFIGKMMWNQWTIGSTIVSGKPKNGCVYPLVN